MDLFTFNPPSLSMWDLVTSGLGALLATSVIGFSIKSFFREPKLPPGVQYAPGPTPLPVLGNVLAVDASAPWITYKKWGSQYGKLFYGMLIPLLTNVP